MPSADPELPYFIPAQTVDEAVSRIFGLTGGLPQNRGEKRALVALRDALDLDVDVVRTNAVLGRRLADTLDVEWVPDEHTVRNKVNLSGLNLLLEAAAEAYHRGALRQVSRSAPSALEGPMWSAFRPAVSKIEAVTRIAGLTGAPDEWLGPGSKEHKTVLTNLADRLMPHANLDRSSKTRLAASIATELGVKWTDSCYSTGETISLEGLNTILAGAERQLGRLGSSAADLLGTPESEGRALAAALYDGWRAERWEARAKVAWMHARSVRGHNDNEWQGFYFEAHGREILNAAFPPSRSSVKVRYGNTTFDYSLNSVWDLKAHTEQQYYPVSNRLVRGSAETLLNDEQAIRTCVAEQGLGFLILSGQAVMDEDHEFVTWHREFKRRQGVRSVNSNSGRSRLRKAAFLPLHVEAFWIANTQALQAAVAAGKLMLKPQGRQAPSRRGGEGASRANKFAMHVDLARSTIAVGRRDWKYPSDSPRKSQSGAEPNDSPDANESAKSGSVVEHSRTSHGSTEPTVLAGTRPVGAQLAPHASAGSVPPFTFVDLFAGIGGFHAMLDHAGGRCVYVSEIDRETRQTYIRNWVDPLPVESQPIINTDITIATPEDAPVDVPEHDVLAAGFPCQPFSKSGYQRGMDEARGTLFWNIARILEERTPAVVLLENVRNLTGPRYRHEWGVIIQTLRELGYRVSSTPSVFSPHFLPPSLGGTPQVRDRVFILGTYVGPDRAMAEVDVPPTVVRAPVDGWSVQDWDANWILDDDSTIPNLAKYRLTADETEWINVWDDLVQRMWAARGTRLPGFPLWADAWIPERGLDPVELDALPRWKADFLIKNARLYDEHRDVIDAWKKANPAFTCFPESRRKLEWQAQDAASLWETVMHLRPSGICASTPAYLPALVAITQTSIVGSRGRRLTPHEAARLQGFQRSFTFSDQRDQASYKQVGNGVAVGAAWHVFRTHVDQNAEDLPPLLVDSVSRAGLNPTRDALDPAALVAEAQLRQSP